MLAEGWDTHLIELPETQIESWLMGLGAQLPVDWVETFKSLAEQTANEGNLSQAQQILDRAMLLAGFLDDSLAMARVWQGRANVLQHFDQLEASLQATQAAVEIYTRHGTEFDIATARTIEVYVLGALERFDEAVALGEWIRPIFDTAQFTLGQAALSSNMARVYTNSWQLERAIVEYKRAQALRQELGQALEVARLWHDMGIAYEQMDEFSKARDCYELAYPQLQKANDVILMSKTQCNLAQLCLREGNFDQALHHIQQARADLTPLPEDQTNRAYIDLFEVQIRRRLDDSLLSNELLHNALNSFQHAGYHIECARVMLEMAHLAAERPFPDDWAQALAYLEQAQNYVQPLSVPLFKACIQLDQGELLWRMGNSSAAQKQAELAHKEFVEAGLDLRAWQATVLLADCRWQLDPQTSSMQYKFVLDQNETSLPVLAARCWLGIGRIEVLLAAREKNPEVRYAMAVNAFEEAITLTDQVRRTLHSHVHQAGFLETKQVLYDELLIALQAQPKQEKNIFAWTERFKAQALAEMLLRQPHDQFIDSDLTALLAERERIRRQLDYHLEAISVENLAFTLENSQRGPMLARHDGYKQTQMVKLQRLLRNIDEQIHRQKNPAQAWREGLVLDADQVHRLLDPDTLLITYYTVQDHLFALTITYAEDDIVSHNLGVTLREIEQEWRHTQRWVTQPRQMHRAKLRLTNLWQRLIAPLAERFQSKNRLLIIPHSTLYQIPFAALFDKKRDSFLIEHWQVQIVPSATILTNCRQRPIATAAPLLIGYPGKPSQPDYLYAVVPEIEKIRQLFPNAAVLLEDQATAVAVLQQLPEHPLIHFSGHITYDHADPLASGIPLAGDHSWLRAADLYLQHGQLEGSLVVISGCDSGRIRPKGNDLLGLTSGFLYAGASAVLAALWKVDDAATSHFMTLFYHQIKHGLPTAKALQTTLQQMLTEPSYNHPYYWAPFTLIGASSSLFPLLLQ